MYVAVLLLVVAMSSAIETAAATIRHWRDFPEAFVREQFGVEPDLWQLEALRAFADPTKPRISLQACAGPGKTAVMAWCAWNFLSCYGDKGEHPKGAAVAITWDNLNDNLWPELAKWQTRSPYLSTAFTWTKERVCAKDHPETWFIAARSWPKSASAEEQGKTLSGLHGQFVLALIDESGAIPLTVLRAAEQALSTNPTFGKILQSGNPLSLEGMLYAAAVTLRHQWTVIRITGDPDDPRRSPRIDLAWAKEQIANYGRDNPWVMAYILGQFPPSSINALLGVEDVERAMQRHLRPDQYQWARKRLGVDVARFGDDRTVIFPRQGLAAFRPLVLREADTVQIAAKVARANVEWADGLAEVFVDDTGHWGHGVYDILNKSMPVTPIVYHAKASDPRYKNLRVEFWIRGAEWVKGGGALPPIPELVAELTTPTYSFVNGVFVLEAKELIKKRLGRSPDLADALFQTFAFPDMPAHALTAQRLSGAQAVRRDGDPFADAYRDPAERWAPAGHGVVLRDGDPFR